MATKVEQLAARIRDLPIDQKLLMASMLLKEGRPDEAEAIARLALDELAALRIIEA